MDTELKNLIKNRVSELDEELVCIRREIHKRPGIGFDTGETEEFIRNFLESEGIEILESSIGVLAVIKGKNSSECIALRADIDGLPLNEQTEVEYKSIYENKMHACGHDGHTAMLLIAAKVLNEVRIKLPRDVMLIFQPAEEGLNLGGARIFVDDFRKNGMLDKIRRIHGLHLTNDYDVGSIRVGTGTVAASTDEFDVIITGKEGHAAEPHKCIDALSIGIKAVSEMESFMSRKLDPLSSSVFSIGMFQSGTARNIVSGKCEFEGTIRCRNEYERAEIKTHLAKYVKALCSLYGAECEVKITDGLPPLTADEKTALMTYRTAERIIGKGSVEICQQMRMYAEDFAYFAECIPASYIWIGSGNKNLNFTERLHCQRFDFDEKALGIGTRLLCGLALSTY